VVYAVVVVEREVGVELSSQAGVAGVEVARERGAPALVEDRLVERFCPASRFSAHSLVESGQAAVRVTQTAKRARRAS
jgi:hypothetical protein